tara:strand:- start:927 stop:1178 length:252 start_codon:yes stop_codon:yes gene_type:complete
MSFGLVAAMLGLVAGAPVPAPCRRAAGFCGDRMREADCVRAGEHTRVGFVGCVWSSNVFGSLECRADFAGATIAHACDQETPP